MCFGPTELASGIECALIHGEAAVPPVTAAVDVTSLVVGALASQILAHGFGRARDRRNTVEAALLDLHVALRLACNATVTCLSSDKSEQLTLRAHEAVDRALAQASATTAYLPADAIAIVASVEITAQLSNALLERRDYETAFELGEDPDEGLVGIWELFSAWSEYWLPGTRKALYRPWRRVPRNLNRREALTYAREVERSIRGYQRAGQMLRAEERGASAG